MVDFYGMSTLVGLFYAEDVFVLFILDDYTIMFFYLTHRWHPKGTITPGQSGPGSNGDEGVLHIPRTPELKLHHQIV